MLLKEEFGQNVIRQVLDKIQSYYNSSVNKFDETIGTLNFWSEDDQDGTVFIESEGAYATVLMSDITEENINNIIKDIKKQLTLSDE